MTKLYTDAYKKPARPKKPKVPKSGGQPARPVSYKRQPRANTVIPTAQYDPREGARVNQLKSGRGGATQAAGIGGMFTLSPWAKQKTK